MCVMCLFDFFFFFFFFLFCFVFVCLRKYRSVLVQSTAAVSTLCALIILLLISEF